MARGIDFGKVIRWGLIIITIGFIAAVFIWNAVAQPESDSNESAWNQAMTLGSPEAENHFIEYTDAVCPYCTFFNIALHSEFDDFQRDYLDSGKIYLELRLTSAIASQNPNSIRANTASYCAADLGNFWPFFNALQVYLNDNYYSHIDFNDPVALAAFKKEKMERIDDQVYLDLAADSNIDIDGMTACLEDGMAESELKQNTARASASTSQGVPYFVFGNYKSSGFSGDYNTVVKMFQAGGAE